MTVKKTTAIIQEEVSYVMRGDPFISDPRVDYAGIAMAIAERVMLRMALMRDFKLRRCRECGEGTVCLQYQSAPLLVKSTVVPICDHCGALWINPETAKAIDAGPAEAGDGLSDVDSDIHGEPETIPRELVSSDEFVRRQALIDAIGIAEFAGAEWTAIVNHVRLMRENWDRFVADATSYKKRLDRELQVAQAESASWKQAHTELNADLQAKRNDLDLRRRQLCTATGVHEDSAWERALADVKERGALVTAAHEAGVKMWRESEPSRAMQLPPTRTDLVAWMLTRIEELEQGHASEIANIKHAFAHIEIELRNELGAIRAALQARDDETTLDAAKRWVSTAMNEAALLNDIDESRGMLCGELVIDDPGNTVEVIRQAALAIARHRLSTKVLSKIRAELAAIEAKSSTTTLEIERSPEWWAAHTTVRLVVTHLNEHSARVIFLMPGRGLSLVAETPEQAGSQLAYARERWPDRTYEVREVRFWRDADGRLEYPVHTLIG